MRRFRAIIPVHSFFLYDISPFSLRRLSRCHITTVMGAVPSCLQTMVIHDTSPLPMDHYMPPHSKVSALWLQSLLFTVLAPYGGISLKLKSGQQSFLFYRLLPRTSNYFIILYFNTNGRDKISWSQLKVHLVTAVEVLITPKNNLSCLSGTLL